MDLSRKHNQKKPKITIFLKNFVSGAILAAFIFILVLPFSLSPAPAYAQGAVDVIDRPLTIQDRLQAEREAAERATDRILKKTTAIAFKTSLHFFLNTLAFDVATWIASGGKGQQPLFYTQGWGPYLTDLADGAAGSFLSQVGEDWSQAYIPGLEGGGINICNPSSLNLKLSLGLGIAEIRRPSRPLCTVSEIVNNFEAIADDPNFLNRFAAVFDPGQNDIGIAFSVFNRYFETTAAEVGIGTKDRETGEFKPITESISGFIKTPGDLVRAQTEAVVGEVGDPEKVYTGEIIADAIDTFTQTLAGKLLQRLFREGLAAFSGSGSSGSPGGTVDLFNPDASPGVSQGQVAAQARFLTFLDAGIITGGPYEILQQLATCPRPDDPGPQDCVIDQRFRLAIEQELTVQEAIDQGYLDGNAPFGFTAEGIQPSYLEGYPYRSLLILRANRIIPVTWELAAEILAQPSFSDELPMTLNQLIAAYDNCGNNPSVFCSLIDKNWLLKAPEAYCKARGPGPINLSEGSSRSLISRDDYCADYQSCIDEADDGSCRFFGYCVEERRTWNLQGESCPAQFNTCQTFQNPQGQLVSYLENTLDFNNCSVDNAGCQWYCSEYNAVDNVWTCLAEDEKVLRPCTSATAIAGVCSLTASCEIPEGETFCQDLSSTPPINLVLSNACDPGSKFWNGTECAVNSSCDIAEGGVSCVTTGCELLPNSLANPSFEIGPAVAGDLAANWSGSLTYFERVSGATEKVFSGSNSLRFFSFGGLVNQSVVSSPLTLPAGTYTFSGYIYSQLNTGTFDLAVAGTAKSNDGLAKNDWQELSFDFTSDGTPLSVTINISGESSGGSVSGAVWFDNFKISESCIVNPVRLTLAGDIDKDESKLHFDRDVEECSAESDGCSAFIRTIPNSGTNILPNSSFEDWPDPFDSPKGWSVSHENFEISTSSPFDTKSVLISSGPGGGLTSDPIVAMKPATTYRISTYIKSDIPFTPGTLLFEYVSGAGPITILTVEGTNNYGITTEWQRIIFDPISTDFAPNPQFAIFYPAGSVRLYIDGVQVEEVATDDPIVSNYKDYGSVNVVHLRKPPDYLDCSGDFENDVGECNNYALYCQAAEVGCESYRPLDGGIPIPGVVSLEDYCPAECVGYETYKQSTTFFESQESLEFFIPTTAFQCNAASAGCDEFTNLDEVAKGGEGREYYQYFRLCELPDDSSCQNFFTWQGSDDTGFQLRVHSLSTNPDGTPTDSLSDPTTWPEAWCDDTTLGPGGQPVCCDAADDVLTNPFCKEFIAADGSLHYRIEPNTVSCSEDCHPFRKTRLGESDTDAEDNCLASSGSWENGACIYQAIPSQGIACPAAAAGCREYRGNTGGNVFTAFFDDFEDGDTVNWAYGSPSAEALNVGGHSIFSEPIGPPGSPPNQSTIVTMVAILSSGACVDNPAIYPECDSATTFDCFNSTLNSCVAMNSNTLETCFVAIGEASCGFIDPVVNAGDTFIISFWAKSQATTLSDIGLELAYDDGAGGASYEFGRVNLTDQWNYYTYGPLTVENDGPAMRLSFLATSGGNADFFVDNIELRKIRDYAYVIKNSWNTPVSCDTDPFLDPPLAVPQFMLGCKQYNDSSNRTHNLKSFTNLCREEAIGCEALIDTYNSDSPFAETFNINDPISEVNVPADELVYLTNRSEFQCPASSQACQAFGLPEIEIDESDNELVSGHNTVYLINDPDQYNSILCRNDEVDCQEYQTENGLTYFKDPGQFLCEYRFSPSRGVSAWFKADNESTKDSNLCPDIPPPLGEDHPTDGYVGLCPSQHSSCDQFVDPVSEVAKNIVFNPDFQQQLDDDPAPDGWTDEPDSDDRWQTLTLKPNTLYTMAMNGSFDGELIIRNCDGISSFDNSVILEDTDSPSDGIMDKASIKALVEDSEFIKYSARFQTSDDVSCEIRILNRDQVDSVAVRETIVNYTLAHSVDKFSCNGVVDPEEGCVLFNDRSAVNFKFGENDSTYLQFDSDLSGAQSDGVAEIDCLGACDSNAILKVRPDRECEQFLSCSTITTETQPDGTQIDRCLGLFACDELADDGSCASTATFEPAANRTAFTPGGIGQIENLSGFARAGVKGTGITTIDGYYPYHLMEQLGESAVVANGNFESTVGNTTEPLAWTPIFDGVYLQWEDFKLNVGTDPSLSKEGTGYLNLNSIYRLESDFVEVFGGTTYTISGWINTLDLFPSPKGEASIMFKEFTPNGDLVPFSATNCNQLPQDCSLVGDLMQWNALVQKNGLPWTFVSQTFKTAPQTGRIKLRLLNREGDATFSEISGTSRFDDISIKPVLKAVDNLFVNQTCRLFPGSDAPSCSFINDDNQVFVGWDGYCLTSDPDNPKSCLQWWPVEQIKGVQINEAFAYDDRVPLYYCIEVDNLAPTINLLNGGVSIRANSSSYPANSFVNNSPLDCEMVYALPNRIDFPDGSWANIQTRYEHGIVYCKIPEDIKIQEGHIILHKSFIDYIDLFVAEPRSAATDFGAFCYPNDSRCGPPSNLIHLELREGGTQNAYEGGVDWNCDTGGPDSYFSFLAGRDLTQEEARAIPIPYLDCNEGERNHQGAAAFFDDEGLLDEIVMWFGDESGFQGNDEQWTPIVNIFNLKDAQCNILAQTVTDIGRNKAWATRVLEGSSYIEECWVIPGILRNPFTDSIQCQYSTDFRPFGAAVINDINELTEPLFWELPLENLAPPQQERAGQSYFVDDLRNLFAQSYNIYKWRVLENDGLCDLDTGQCTENNNPGIYPFGRFCITDLDCLAEQGYSGSSSTDLGWSVPTNLCSNNSRVDDAGYCGVAPTITNITVNEETQGQIEIHQSGNVALEFNVGIDENQLPLKSYRVDWGDNTEVSYSGVNLRARPNESNKFTLNHYYNYWQLRSQGSGDTIEIDTPAGSPIRCSTDTSVAPPNNFCEVDIKIHVRDNWGWCSGNLEFGQPESSDQWGYFAGNNSYNFNTGIYDGTSDGGDGVYDCDDLDAWTSYPGSIKVYQD